MSRNPHKRPLRDAGIWGLPRVKTIDRIDPWELAAQGKRTYARRLLGLQGDEQGLRRLLEQMIDAGDYFEAVAVNRELTELTGTDPGVLTRTWHRQMGERLLAENKPSLALQAFAAAGDAAGVERARALLGEMFRLAPAPEPEADGDASARNGATP